MDYTITLSLAFKLIGLRDSGPCHLLLRVVCLRHTTCPQSDTWDSIAVTASHFLRVQNGVYVRTVRTHARPRPHASSKREAPSPHIGRYSCWRSQARMIMVVILRRTIATEAKKVSYSHDNSIVHYNMIKRTSRYRHNLATPQTID